MCALQVNCGKSVSYARRHSYGEQGDEGEAGVIFDPAGDACDPHVVLVKKPYTYKH